MRLIGIGLAMALALGALAPTAALAAAPKPDKAALARGMKEAPAALQATDLKCTLTEARFVGDNVDPKTKKVVASFYEVGCKEGLGFVISANVDKATKPTAYNCIEAANPQADGKPSSIACQLPSNADTKAAIAPFVAASGRTCVVEKIRGIGAAPTATFFEVACQGGAGYIVQTSTPPDPAKPVALNSCLEYPAGNNLECKFTDTSTMLKVADTLASASGKGCTVSDRRYVGIMQSGKTVYEVSCGDGKGYMLEQSVDGSLSRTIDCVNADGLAGGCQLTDTRAAKTEQAGLYTRLSKKAGFECDVTQYAPFPSPPTIEVVELKCANRPDGAVASFGATSSVYDCAHSELFGYRCSYTKGAALFSSLQADLTALNRVECKVSDWRGVGANAGKTVGWNEVACADGTQGYFIEYALQPKVTPTMAVICSQAKGIGGGCKLPGNTKK